MKQLTFASLQVRNLQAAKDFYTNKLGFEVAESNPQACVFKYNKGAASFAIRTPLSDIEEKELGVGVSIWFAIDGEVDRLKERFVKQGLSTIGPIMETPFGKAFHVEDLDGYRLTFLEPK